MNRKAHVAFNFYFNYLFENEATLNVTASHIHCKCGNISETVPDRGLFLAVYSSTCTLPLSVLWSLSFPLTTTFPWRTSYLLWPIISVSKACYYHIRELCCIRPYLDSWTVSTILSFPPSFIKVIFSTTSCHISPILRSLHWLRIIERIKYKLLSLTYKVLTTA